MFSICIPHLANCDESDVNIYFTILNKFKFKTTQNNYNVT